MKPEHFNSKLIEITPRKKMYAAQKNNLISHIPSNENGHYEATDVSQVSRKKKWKWRKNKKLDKSEKMNNEEYNGKPTNQPGERALEDSCSTLQPAKKRKKKNKIVPAEDNTVRNMQGPKTVVIIKTPDDYSANWKQLKKIIDKEKENQTHGKICSGEDKVSEYKSKKCNRNDSIRKYNEKIKESKPVIDKKRKQAEKTKTEKKMDIWFDNIDPILLGEPEEESEMENCQRKANEKMDDVETATALVKTKCFEGITKAVAMDCEMVGVGMNGQESILARVTIVNHFGKVLYDKFVKPTEEVVDFRTKVSGIRLSDLEGGVEFSTVQKEVSELLAGRILVGHAVRNDLKVLFLSHPWSDIRDTSRYKGFRRLFGGAIPSLKKLTQKIMGVQIQSGEHNSIQDAQAAMRLYTLHRREWEKLKSKKKRKLSAKKKKVSTTVAEIESETESQ